MATPKQLWDNYIELKVLIFSHIVHQSYELKGKVCETHMMVQTADINNLCDFEWYEWVMFCDPPVTYPNLVVTLNQSPGPCLDVHNTTTYKFFLTNGKVVSCTTV